MIERAKNQIIFLSFVSSVVGILFLNSSIVPSNLPTPIGVGTGVISIGSCDPLLQKDCRYLASIDTKNAKIGLMFELIAIFLPLSIFLLKKHDD